VVEVTYNALAGCDNPQSPQRPTLSLRESG
jgi:hypothetical protein